MSAPAFLPGRGLTVTDLEIEVPLQDPLEGKTVTEPVEPEVEKGTVAVIEEVPCPEEITHPEGTVQVYVVALLTPEIVNVCDVPAQKEAFPLIEADELVGVVVTVTALLPVEEEEQAPVAITDTFPEVVPAVTLIELVP